MRTILKRQMIRLNGIHVRIVLVVPVRQSHSTKRPDKRLLQAVCRVEIAKLENVFFADLGLDRRAVVAELLP